MSQNNLWIKPLLIVISAGVMLGLIIFLLIPFISAPKNIRDPGTYTQLNWNPDETISIDYDKCKDLNRSLYINRIFKKDFRIPMCPERYVILYDKSQEIVFKFNENKNENPARLIIDVACDNSSGKC